MWLVFSFSYSVFPRTEVPMTEYILKVERTGFPDRLDGGCERKRGAKVFSVSTTGSLTPIEMGKTADRIGFEGEGGKMGKRSGL